MGLGKAAEEAQLYSKGAKQIGALAEAQPEDIRARRANAEQVYSNVVNRLGAAGTYGPTPTTPETTSTDTPGGVFKNEKLKVGGIDPLHSSKAKTSTKARVLDTQKYQQNLEGSTQFRLMSKLTAEAEQMVNREGPLYDEMLKNTQLPIIEGSAAMSRENTENLRRAMGRGGAARRTALESVQKIRAQERINSTKVQQLAQTRMGIDTWARDNAKNVLEFGQNWAANLGGIRESYQSAMDHAAELMTSSALPLALNALGQAEKSSARAQALRAQMHAERKAKTGQWISGVLAVGSLLLGGAGAGLFGAGALGAVGGATGAVAKNAGALTSAGIKMGTSALGGGE